MTCLRATHRQTGLRSEADRVPRQPLPGAWLAAVALPVICCARYSGFIYPNYLGALAFQSGVLALAWLWAWQWCRCGSRARGLALAEICLGAYALLSVLSCLWAPSARLSLIGSIPIVFCVVWAIGIGRTVRSREGIRLVLRGMFVAGVIAALTGLYYVCLYGAVRHALPFLREFKLLSAGTEFLAHLRITRGEIKQALGHRNFLAIFLLPPILLGAADILSPVPARGAKGGRVLRWPPRPVAACVIVMLTALVLCKSVGAMLGLLVGAGALLAVRLSRRRRLVLLGVAMSLTVVLIVLLVLPSVGQWLIERHGSQATRWYMWHGTLRMILDRPALGWGAGMFLPHFADYKPTFPMRYGWLLNLTIYPHNELLLVAVGGGVAALLLYVVAGLFMVRSHLRKAEQVADAGERILPWAVFACFTAMFVHGLVSVSLRFWAPAAAYWTLAGLLLAFPRTGEDAPAASRAALPTGTSAVVVLGLSLAILVGAKQVVWSGARAEWLMAGALERPGVGFEKRLHGLVEAADRSRYVPDCFIALRTRASMLHRKGRIDDAITAYEDIESLAPGYKSVRRRLGGLYAKRASQVSSGNPKAAEQDWRRAVGALELSLRQNPYNYGVRHQMVRTLMAASHRNLPHAMRYAEEGVRIAPEKAMGYFVKGRLLAQVGQKSEALACLEKALARCGRHEGELAAHIAHLCARLREETAR